MRYMGECTGFSSTDPRLEGLVGPPTPGSGHGGLAIRVRPHLRLCLSAEGAPSTREPGPMFAVELHGRGATVVRPSPRWALPRKDL